MHTLALQPGNTSHRQLDDAELAAGIGRGTVRVAVCIEHPDDLCDLWSGLEQALAKP